MGVASGAWRRLRRYARKAFAPPGIRLAFLAAASAMAATVVLTLSWRQWPAGILLGVATLAILFIDARTFRIPDALSLPLAPIGLVLAVWPPGGASGSVTLLDALLGMLVGGGMLYALRALYLRLRGIEGLGLGDVKLAAAGGAWTGLSGVPTVLLVASVAAIAWVLILSVVKGRVGLSTRMPFGVTLAPAIWIVWWLAASSYM